MVVSGAISILLAFSACGGGGGTTDVVDAGPEVVTNQCVDSEVNTDYGQLPMTVETSVERPLFNNKTYYLEMHRPSTCQSAVPCMGIVLVPPGLESGEEYFDGYADELAASIPAVVFVYNPQGRGVGSNMSAGEEDFMVIYNVGPLGGPVKLLGVEFDAKLRMHMAVRSTPQRRPWRPKALLGTRRFPASRI